MIRLPRELVAGGAGAGEFAVEWNKIPAELRRLAWQHLRVESPLELHATLNGMTLRIVGVEIRRWAKLTAGTYGGYDGGVAADLLEWTGTKWGKVADVPQIMVYPLFAAGYYFDRSFVECRYNDTADRWYVASSGDVYCWGTLAADLAEGGYANLTVSVTSLDTDDTNPTDATITVYEQWGTADAGDKIGVLWNGVERRWEGALQACD